MPKPNPNAPLYLPPLQAPAEYVIGCPPLQSSGDIYHILAYLMLCRHYDVQIPQVILFWSNSGDKKHAGRGYALAELLGFSKFIALQEIKPSVNRPYAVQAAVRAFCKDDKTRHVHLIDQKQTTAFIVQHVKENGLTATQAILQKSFLKLHVELNVADKEAITTWIKSEIVKIRERTANKALVLFNCRYSDGANQKQNAFAVEEAAVVEFVEKHGAVVWRLNASDAVREDASSTTLFPPASWQGKYNLDKLRHIILLSMLLKHLPSLVGMVGNTSGILDIAAFLGHRVFCFHEFGAGRNPYFASQDYRVLLQTALMAVSQRLTVRAAKQQLQFWLKAVTPRVTYPYGSLQNSRGMELVVGENDSTVAERLPYSNELCWSGKGGMQLAVKTAPRANNIGTYQGQQDGLKLERYHTCIFHSLVSRLLLQSGDKRVAAAKVWAAISGLVVDYVGPPERHVALTL